MRLKFCDFNRSLPVVFPPLNNGAEIRHACVKAGTRKKMQRSLRLVVLSQ